MSKKHYEQLLRSVNTNILRRICRGRQHYSCIRTRSIRQYTWNLGTGLQPVTISIPILSEAKTSVHFKHPQKLK